MQIPERQTVPNLAVNQLITTVSQFVMETHTDTLCVTHKNECEHEMRTRKTLSAAPVC